jgi:uncharacterized protein
VNRLFLDANVLFTAAHNPAGKASLLFDIAERGYWTIITSNQGVAEALHNLRRKSPNSMSRLEMLLKDVMIVPTMIGQTCNLTLPAKDVPIYLAALHAKSSHLLTGDICHFGPYMNNPARTKGVIICTVASYLEQILK